MYRLLLVVLSLSVIAPSRADAQPQLRPPGRYMAITPPGASENGYANFLWVLDTQTGEVTAYRIANAKSPDGSGGTWVREKIITEAEFAQYQRQQRPSSP